MAALDGTTSNTKQLYYSTIGMDRGTPELKEKRQRPNPAFVPMSAKKPKNIKVYKPKIDDPKSPGYHGNNKDIAEYIPKQEKNKLGEIRELPLEMEKMSLINTQHEKADSSLQDFSRFRQYADDSFKKAEIRGSKDNPDLIRTHTSPLRQSKEKPLQYQ